MTMQRRIDDALRDAAAAQTVPGFVALAATDRETIYQGAFGRRDLSADAAMTLDTVFWIASMTKAVVSVGGMQFVEQGRLSLGAPIGEILPALKAPMVLHGFDAAGVPQLRPAQRAITLRHLLTHTSGYGYDTWNAELMRVNEHFGTARVLANWADVERTVLLFEPGTRWNYGISTDLVGKAVEVAAGQTLDVYLRDHVLAPLGMHDSGFVLTAAQRARQARMHARDTDGTLRPIDHASGDGFAVFRGGGRMCSTAGDYLRFLRMLLGGGNCEG